MNQSYPARRRGALALIAASALVVTAASACGGDDSAGDAAGSGGPDELPWDNVVIGPEATQEQPVAGGSLVVGMGSEPVTLAPPDWQGVDYNVAFAIFDPLVAPTADGTLQPYLAESVEPNEALDRWTVTLRPEVRFHDGTPLDAETLVRMWDDYVVNGTSTGQITEYVERLEVEDELTVTYLLRQPHAQFPEVLTLPMGWPFSPDAADERGDELGERPAGTGPFEVVSWQRDSEIVLQRNDDYWQEGMPYLDDLTFRYIPDETTRALALQSGDVDVAQSVQQSRLSMDVADGDGVQVVVGRTNNGRGMMFNTTAPPTDDQRVRQALAHAVDQEAFLPVVAGDAAPLSELRTQFFPRDSQFYSEAVAAAWPGYDVEEAQRLHDSYADDLQRSDGREVGEPVELTIKTPARPATEELAEAYADAYEAAGFDVEVEPVEAAQVSGTAITRDYQALVFGLGSDRSPLGELERYFASPDLVSNFMGFHDDRVAELIDQLRTAGDAEEQARLTEEMGLHLAEQMPFHWLATAVTFFAAGEDVHGLRSWTFPDGELGNGSSRAQTMWGQIWRTD